MKVLLVSLLILYMTHITMGDLYLHNMRGSNNRLAETTAQRTNGNRLFDSQNNARGGYNVGDKTTASGVTSTNPDYMSTGTQTPQQTFTDDTGTSQYPLVYLEGSEVSVSWTAQHGCGGNEQTDVNQLNCNMVLQYACDSSPLETDMGMTTVLRDGAVTTTPQAATAGQGLQGTNGIQTAITTNNNAIRGRHESEAYYYECQMRDRNTDLFIADQNLNGRTAAIYTRQNPNGGQRGLECPEERDYYPYWGPSIWRDVAIMTDHLDDCNTLMAPLSQNVVWKGKCTDTSGQYTTIKIRQTTKAACEASNIGGVWRNYTWGLPAPVCVAADWSRVNHLGSGREGHANMYNWTLPTVDTLKATGARTYNGDQFTRCVMRLRYNTSTDDYNPKTTNRLQNDATNTDPLKSASPVVDDPTIDIGVQYIDYDNQDETNVNNVLVGLRLAIDTTQFGRTFQDRSHVFYIQRRAAAVQTLVANNATTGVAGKIYNLNVIGKRGNIVQTFPSVEYDFFPNVLSVTPNDLIHIQWTGSNTHNNGGDGGDGQAGDAGQGTTGTDRHNFAFMGDLKDNFPLPLDKPLGTAMWDSLDCYEYNGVSLPQIDCQVRIASSGYFWNLATAVSSVTGTALNPLLNNAPPSLRAGILVKFKDSAAGQQYNYMSTRNNSFSNRSQKGSIIINAA